MCIRDRLCTVLRFPVRGGVSSAPFSFARPGSYLDSNVLGAAVPTLLDVHPLLLPDTDLGAYSRGSKAFFSVRYEFHTFHDGDTKQLPQAKLPRGKIRKGFFRRVAEHHRRLGHARALVRRANTVAATLLWELRHVLGRPQAQAPPRPGRSRGGTTLLAHG